MSIPILMVAHGLDPVGTGGQLLQAGRWLLASGREVHLAVTSRAGGAAEELAQAGASLHRVGRRPAPDPAAIAETALLIRRLKPRLICSWGWSGLQVAAAASAVERGGHRPALLAAIARPLRTPAWSSSWLTRRMLERCDLVLAATQATAVSCRRLGLPEPRVRLCPPGVSPYDAKSVDREALARRLGIPPDSPWTLCVAPLVARSRLERLIWAVDQLDVVLPGLVHVLVGSGPLAAQLARRSRAQSAAERLRMLPNCPWILDLLAETRLVWQTGDVAHGGALLEALAAGVPAVAVHGDAADSIIEDGVTGRLVTADPPSDLPRRGLPILEDDAVFDAYAAASRQRARNYFSLAAASEIWNSAIESLDV
jgi:glycosyltransferase involved in cell wall biosynthesis